MPDDLIRSEMAMIRAMGANFIRLAHYQQSRLVLDLCDELGLLVWEEVPWCRSGVGDEAFQRQTRAMLHDMIDQHFNHPSIILWGRGNEDDWPDECPATDKEAIRGFMHDMNQLAHQLDPSRSTSFADVILPEIFQMYMHPRSGRDGTAVLIPSTRNRWRRSERA